MQKLLVMFFCLPTFSLGTFALGASFSELFEKYYHEKYDPGKCGENIRGFVGGLHTEFGNVDGLHVVRVTNKGLSVFGMINAEVARGMRFNKPVASEANWFHHFFLLDEHGIVADFDFKAEPTLVPIADYLEVMFLDEPECDKPVVGRFCGGRATKLRDYFFESVTAESVRTKTRGVVQSAMMEAVLTDWRVLLPRTGED